MARQSRRPLQLSSQVVLGAIIVLVGVLLLLDTTEVYDASQLFRYIPSLFVLLGLYSVVRSGFRNIMGPGLVILVAAAWQLVALDLVQSDELLRFWPVLVVLFGLSLLVNHVRRPAPEGDAGAQVSTLAIFGGSETRSTSKSFTGADLTAMFGGAELDLRDAAVADPPAHVSAIALFGGVDVIVPREWNVQVDVLPILGGATDDRPRREGEHDEVDLVVTGFAAFGGVTVED